MIEDRIPEKIDTTLMVVQCPGAYPWGQVKAAAQKMGLPQPAVVALMNVSLERYGELYPSHVLNEEGFVAGITGTNWAEERQDVLDRFSYELSKATGDGSKKRQAGTKPPWYVDPAHEAAMFSHLMKWKRGEKVDADSGAHPLVHLAWRALAIACAESGNVPNAE